MIAWVDCSVAATGEMLLAALLDAGARRDRIEAGLSQLQLPGWTLDTEIVRRGPFAAQLARFFIDADLPQRPWRTVRELIRSAGLQPEVTSRSLATYERLARAAGSLQGIPTDQVHLPEVGSTRALIEIVSVVLALQDLGIDTLYAGPLPTGPGGSMVGRSLTLAVLESWPVIQQLEPGVWVSPIGAALIRTLAQPGFPAMTLGRTGHGAGAEDAPGLANVLGVSLGEGETRRDVVIEIACNVDDMPGEYVPSVVSALLQRGAVDAWSTPIAMKRGRPGLTLQALVRPEDAERLTEELLRHSTARSVRRRRWERVVLDVKHETVTTRYGAVRITLGTRDGETYNATPEHRDVAQRAAESGVPEHQVYRETLAVWSRLSD